MPYNAEISRLNPSCILFLLDQSHSMNEEFITSDGKRTKAQGVADVINRSLQTLVAKCTKSAGINDYYHVGVIGYSGNGVVPALSGGPLEHKDLVPISLIGNYPARVERRVKQIPNGKGGFIEKKLATPVWVEPRYGGVTPICEAFRRASRVINQWLLEHPDCFPPIIINITDGEASDGNPLELGRNIMSLKSSDGNVLLFNLHISSSSNRSIQFPDSPSGLPDELAEELFSISSVLTSYMVKVIGDEGGSANSNSRGFAFNADFNTLLRFIDIGTRPKELGTGGELNQGLNQLFPS
ncbi:MAG: VWA domain-containing protein [Candidatus Obscuribacterales bacterium]|nr:VWA domain-containing protein [Candidatus Obscuribacterales bacterium]